MSMTVEDYYRLMPIYGPFWEIARHITPPEEYKAQIENLPDQRAVAVYKAQIENLPDQRAVAVYKNDSFAKSNPEGYQVAYGASPSQSSPILLILAIGLLVWIIKD